MGGSSFGSGGGGGHSGSGGSFVSSRFGSSIDARRKLNIIQNQHQHNLAAALNSSSHVVAHLPQALASRRDLMSYALSLMRTFSNEHRDFTPNIDLASLKHVAYVFDGLMYFLRVFQVSKTTQASSRRRLKTTTPAITGSAPQPDNDPSSSSSSDDSSWEDESDNDTSTNINDDDDDDATIITPIDDAFQLAKKPRRDTTTPTSMLGEDNSSTERRRHRQRACVRTSSFFRRSNSTVCLGGRCPDPFNLSLNESLPLALKPHLLHPYSRTQDLFKPGFTSKQRQDYNSLRKIGLMSSSLRTYSPVFHNTQTNNPFRYNGVYFL